jgi:hypothetical protein
MQQRAEEEAAECRRSGWKRVPTEQQRGAKANEDPFAPRRSLAASEERESTNCGYPSSRPDDAECERRPKSWPVADGVKHTFLLQRRQVSRMAHR